MDWCFSTNDGVRCLVESVQNLRARGISDVRKLIANCAAGIHFYLGIDLAGADDCSQMRRWFECERCTPVDELLRVGSGSHCR